MHKHVNVAAAMVVWGSFALAGDIEVYRAKDIEIHRATEIQPDPPRTPAPQPAAPAPKPAPVSPAQPALPAPVQAEQSGPSLAKVLWEPRDTSLTLPANIALDLQAGDRATGRADLKLLGFELTSEAGQLAQVDRATWEAGPGAVPAGQWQTHVSANRGSSLYLLRLNSGRGARIILGTTEMDWSSARAASPGDIATPTAFRLVNIRYWLSFDGKADPRRVAGGKFDANLVGSWKMTRPGGAMIADVPGAGDTILTRVGGWSATDKGTLTVNADGSYRWQMPDGMNVRGRCYRIRPASPALGHTYWAVDGLGDDGFITFDFAATHETSDGLWAGNRAEPMAIGGKRK